MSSRLTRLRDDLVETRHGFILGPHLWALVLAGTALALPDHVDGSWALGFIAAVHALVPFLAVALDARAPWRPFWLGVSGALVLDVAVVVVGTALEQGTVRAFETAMLLFMLAVMAVTYIALAAFVVLVLSGIVGALRNSAARRQAARSAGPSRTR